jgi:hypothetical protein
MKHEAGYTRLSLEEIVGCPVVNRHMEEALATEDSEMFRMVATRELLVSLQSSEK